MSELFSAVLVANRGEIAVRVIATLQRLGIASVAVYTDAEAGAAHVRAATWAVRIPSYLDAQAIVAAATTTGAQAIHPGYGFLAERADFARACDQAGLVFIGPSPRAIETMGDKITARTAVAARGVPVVPGVAQNGLDDEALIAGAEQVGFPLLIKPAAGGGGKGMHQVTEAGELPAALATARREAAGAFGDDTLFLERFVTNPRHIEVQVLADSHGNVVHLGERECSLQRRHQKVIEEAPSPLLSPAQREALGRAAIETARAVDYVGAGTVEFIVSGNSPDDAFFMEMNTRLQVEHPVTEEITGIDLVAQQVRIAAGQALEVRQEDLTFDGHAIEARVYAEDPDAGFLPTGGTVVRLALPGGPGVRVDHALQTGDEVGTAFDPMLAKVIASAPTREEALAKLDRALAHTHVLGVVTNTAFLRMLLTDPAVVAGRLDTGLIERRLPDLTRPAPSLGDYAVAALVRWHAATHAAPQDLWHAPTGWRLSGQAPFVVRFAAAEGAAAAGPAADAGVVTVALTGTPQQARARINGTEFALALHTGAGTDAVTIDGQRQGLSWHNSSASVWVSTPEGDRELLIHTPARRADTGAGVPTLDSPMPGTVVAVMAADGDAVEAGEPVLAVEAMKMEHLLRAPSAGIVRLHVKEGQSVARGQELAQVRQQEGDHD